MQKEKNVVVNKNAFITSPLEMLSALSISLPCGGSTALRRGRRVVNKYFLFAADARRSCEGVSKGFTLIELLVVVLIIGILTAVAVPQYQKAVLKSRFANTLSAMETAINASKIYYISNGNFPDNKDALDIETPCLIWKNNKGKTTESFIISCELYDRGISAHTRATFYSSTNPLRYCVAYDYIPQAIEFCKTFTEKNAYSEQIGNLLLYRFKN